MWLFGSNNFLSVVQSSDDSRDLVVRARRQGDIERFFPNAKVITLPGRDYQFRAILPREEVAIAVSEYVMGIKYTNFKNSVRDTQYHNACSRVWSVMAGLQKIPPYSTGRQFAFLGDDE